MTTPLLSSLFAEPWAIYRPALQGLLKQVQQVSPAAIETHDGRFLRGARNAYLRGNVAVIPVIGPIAHHFDWLAYIANAK